MDTPDIPKEGTNEDSVCEKQNQLAYYIQNSFCL